MTGNGYGVDEYGVGVYGLLSAGGLDEIVLDPLEVAEGRTALSLTSGEIRVADEGPDWGEAALEAFQAEMEIGSVPADVRWPNRIVRIPLLLGALGPSFEAARASLQQKVGLFQREGGWVKRDNLYADVVNASLTMPDKWGWRSLEPEVILTLECIPDFYGDEVTLTSHVEVTNPVLVFIETGIPGDMPGRVSIALNEFQGVPQRGVVWGWRSRHYSAADTAQLRYRAQDMDPQDASAVVAMTGSVSGSAVRHQSLVNLWTPILSTDITDGPLSHTGSYRVLARVQSSSVPNTVRARFVWDVGDLTNPTENEPWTLPGLNNFYVADLGEIRLDAAPIGEHRWRGQVQGYGSDPGGGNLAVDELWFVPIDEGSGTLRSSLYQTNVFSSYAARDHFGQTAGALNGKAMIVGGNWATSGDATDFTVDTAFLGGTAKRSEVSDAANTGRLALAGTGTEVFLSNQVTFLWTAVGPATGTPMAALYQRYVDASNLLYARVFQNQQDFTTSTIEVYRRIGGSSTLIGSRTGLPALVANQTYALQLWADADGSVACWLKYVNPGSGVIGAVVTSDPVLATGGALASGRHGFYDANEYPFASDRYYDDYFAWVPEPDAVMFAGRALELRTDGAFRESIDVTRFGEVADVEGDLPRIPVAGLEGRFTELFVKASRGDLRDLPDNGVDNIVGTIRFRPSFIFPR